MKKGLQILHTESICQFEQQSISDSQLAKSLMGKIIFQTLEKQAGRSEGSRVFNMLYFFRIHLRLRIRLEAIDLDC